MKVCMLVAMLWLPLGAAFVVDPFVSTGRSSAMTHDVSEDNGLFNKRNMNANSKRPTSTTLFYRDDVPPIGSTPTWELPNDFSQFVTQRSIQSFMFLLDSLKDDYTLRWLNEFTDPVLFMNQNIRDDPTSATDNGATGRVPHMAQTEMLLLPKKLSSQKVSLEQAVLSAFTLTEELIEEESDEGMQQTKKPKSQKSEKKKKRKKALVVAVEKTAFKMKSNKRGICSMSAATDRLLSNRISIQTAFAFMARARSMAKVEAMPTKLTIVDSKVNHQEESYSSCISTLYSPFKVPKKQAHEDGPTNKFAPYSPKTSSGPKTNFAPYVPPHISKYVKKKKHDNDDTPTSKSEVVPSSVTSRTYTSANSPTVAPTCTSSLYDAPDSNRKVKHVPVAGSNASSRLISSTSGGPLYKLIKSADNQQQEAKTTSKEKVLKYHGLAMLNVTRFPTWDAYFESLLEQPKALLTIESYHDPTVSYDLDIDPASLCRRMLSVRTQIASECQHDLEVISTMGDLTLKSYHKMLREIREQEVEKTLQDNKDQLEKHFPKSMEDSISHNNGAAATDDVSITPQTQQPTLQRANLLFLESSVAPTGTDNAGAAPSPLRKGNFDLLMLLATQEAIHRVLNDPSRQARKSAEYGSNRFLQDFYVQRLMSHFSGDQCYGRADDFIEEMLTTSPRMISVDPESSDCTNRRVGNDDNSATTSEDSLTKDLTYLVDPVKVAATVLGVRDKLALQWKEQLEKETKEAHMAIQKMALTKLMRDAATADECKIADTGGKEPKGEDGWESCFE